MAFNLPLQNFFSRTTGPAVYSRPSDWPVITDVATEVQFLFCDLGDATCAINTNFTRTSGSQNITIDWGDGTTSTVTSIFGSYTNKTYTPGTGTPCSLGYTTWKIRVYFTGTGTSVLDNCNIMPKQVIPFQIASPQNCAVLEAYYGNSTQNVTRVNFYSGGQGTTGLGIYANLEFVKLPATVTWSFQANLFYLCTALKKVVMPTSNSAASSYQTTFADCYSLLEVVFPSNATSVTSFLNTFQNCFNLRSVTFPTTLNSCTTFNSCFLSCINLRTITFPSINACNNFGTTFNECRQLEWVKFTSMPTVVGAITMASCFANCINLQNVYFPATGTAGSIYDLSSTFSACSQLKNIVFPSNINVSNFTNTFSQCVALGSCILPTNTPACSSFNSIFSGCASLLKITLPTTAAANTQLVSAFATCYKLEQITIPSGYSFSRLDGMCNNCLSLKTFTWTPGVQNSLTNFNSAFNGCTLLTSITMPTSMTALQDFATTFQNCRSLLTLTLPSTLNAVTSMSGCFSGCNSLTSVALPTSMSACTNFSFTFSGCRVIESITLPNTVGAVTTFRVCFNQCVNLKTCVLPGAAQLSAVTVIDIMFNGCSDLVTLTNFNKIGSLTATPLINASTNNYNRFTGGSAISFSGPLSKLDISSQVSSTNVITDVQSVRLLNASAGQWTGTSPQINVSYTNMSTAQIVQLFNDMAAQGNVVSKTINITSATGAAALTAANRLIVTSKGWTITG
jgi:hypothetical protein